MGVMPRTFKFKTDHQMIFRRIRGVKSVRLVVAQDVYEIEKTNGAKAFVPYGGTVVLMGRLVEFKKGE